MTFWYASVGIRLALMVFSNLSANNFIYKLILPRPLSISSNATVDRSLQSIRLRSIITIIMAFAEFYAGGLRVSLWLRGLLNLTQQEMMIKNLLFLVSVISAFLMINNLKSRKWNRRDLIPGVLRKPSREMQKEIARWAFVLSYLVVAGILTAFLVQDYHYINNHGNTNQNGTVASRRLDLMDVHTSTLSRVTAVRRQAGSGAGLVSLSSESTPFQSTPSATVSESNLFPFSTHPEVSSSTASNVETLSPVQLSQRRRLANQPTYQPTGSPHKNQNSTAEILLVQSTGGDIWLVNIVADVALVIFFLVYCRNAHSQKVSLQPVS